MTAEAVQNGENTNSEKTNGHNNSQVVGNALQNTMTARAQIKSPAAFTGSSSSRKVSGSRRIFQQTG
ncbi:hypothetical protein HII12_003062 [Brettanomyces bruxellensis]|uniref:Uncharacterized protein n=1 Tax=Dekkera bruxellensis TaxID=5007 RepID=A0A8H6ET88_DEKBR|nr:hypothetical protein HII12_003062 [Brettanomyces bruxellensis]